MADKDQNGSNNGGGGNPWMKSLFIWAGILLALVLFVQIVDGGGRTAAGEGMAYSEFLNRVDEGSVKEVVIGKDVITGRLTNDEQFRTNMPQDVQLVDRLKEKGVAFSAQPEQQTSVWLILLYQSLPFLLILGISFFVMRQMQKNAGSGCASKATPFSRRRSMSWLSCGGALVRKVSLLVVRPEMTSLPMITCLTEPSSTWLRKSE